MKSRKNYYAVVNLSCKEIDEIQKKVYDKYTDNQDISD